MFYKYNDQKLKQVANINVHVRIQRGIGGPDPPEKSQKYRVS